MPQLSLKAPYRYNLLVYYLSVRLGCVRWSQWLRWRRLNNTVVCLLIDTQQPGHSKRPPPLDYLYWGLTLRGHPHSFLSDHLLIWWFVLVLSGHLVTREAPPAWSILELRQYLAYQYRLHYQFLCHRTWQWRKWKGDAFAATRHPAPLYSSPMCGEFNWSRKWRVRREWIGTAFARAHAVHGFKFWARARSSGALASCCPVQRVPARLLALPVSVSVV